MKTKLTVTVLLYLLLVNSMKAQFARSEWTSVNFRSLGVIAEAKVAPDPLTEHIPVSGKHPERYALICGNENYGRHGLGLQEVKYAKRDARAFREYARIFFGIPEDNIIYLEDATAGLMFSSVERLSLFLRTAPPGAEVYYYFSGHGLQMPASGSFIPAALDDDPQNLNPANSFIAIMEKLSRGGLVRVIAFTDACFSGRTRDGNGGLAVRGVRYEKVPGTLSGNVIHFGGAGSQEYAFAWEEKGHGLFTAVLLIKLSQCPKGLSWGRLTEQVRTGVMEKAARLHYASQEPVLNGSAAELEQFRKTIIR